MKAYIVTLRLEDMEVPWTDNEFNGPNVADEITRWLVIDETAAKAKYNVIAHSLDATYLEDMFTIGYLLCIATVQRTKRKYEYKHSSSRLLEFYRTNYLRQPYGE